MYLAALAFLLAVNAWVIRCFRVDKLCAVRGHPRISEARLLFLAAIGGSPGAFFARHRFRHKTRKQPFSALLWLVLVLQVAALIGWLAASR